MAKLRLAVETSISELDSPPAATVKPAAAATVTNPLVIVTDARGTVTAWGGPAEETFGLAPSEAVGRPVDDVIVPQGPIAIADCIEALVSGREPDTLTSRRPDGSPLLFSVSLMTDEHDRPISFVLIEHAVVTQGDTLLSTILGAAQCALWYADVRESGSNRYLFWDTRFADEDAAQRVSGVYPAPGQTLAEAWYQSRLPDDRAKCDRRGTASVRAGRSYEQEFRYRSSSGEVRWLRETVSVEVIVPSSRWRAVGVCTDITTSKHAEEVLQRQSELLDLAHDVVVVLNIDNRIVFWNRSAERTYGYSRAEAEGKLAMELLHTRFPTSFEDVISQLMKSGSWEGELTNVARDSTEIVMSSRWALQRGPTGEPHAVLEIDRDVTAERRHERHIEALNTRLRRTMQETHHRVKNNLQLVAAMLDMSMMDNEGGLPSADAKRLAAQVMALATIHDLLTIEAGEGEEPGSRISSGKMLNRLIKMLTESASHIHFETDVAEVKLSVRQATGVALAANELVSNAIKHGDGHVKIRFGCDDGICTLDVHDNGPGFGPDFSLHAAANTGLMLVDNVVKHDLAGKMEFGSGAGGGGFVRITHPHDTV